MEEICQTADGFDDVFIEKFGAQRLSEMKVQKFSFEQAETAWTKYQAYLKEGLAYLDYFEGRRIPVYG